MRIPSVRRWLVTSGVACAIGLLSSTDATAGPWTSGMASGANSAFGWTGGQNNTDRFGNPTVSTAGFFFDNTNNFTATVGTQPSTTDFARVTVDTALAVPPTAPLIHEIQVVEFGTWSSPNAPAPNYLTHPDFTVQADFQVFRNSPTPQGTTGALGYGSGTGFIVFNSDGTWSASRTLTSGGASPPFSNVDWRRFLITVTNTIQVSGSAPAGSTISKTGMRIYVPEPSTILFLFAGFGPLVLRRSSRRGSVASA